MASQEGIAGQFREGARGARPARLAADRSRWLPRPGARSPAECLGTAYRTSAAPLTICRMVSVIRALGIPVQTHHSRPHFARATWQPGPARRSRRGANAPGWKTFSKRTRSVLAKPAPARRRSPGPHRDPARRRHHRTRAHSPPRPATTLSSAAVGAALVVWTERHHQAQDCR